jgi:hypothetical protein
MSAPKAVAAKAARAAGAAAKSAGKPTRLRKVPAKVAPAATMAPAAASGLDGDASAAARRLAADIDAALAQGRTDLLSPDALQALIAAVCRSYSAQIEAGGNFPPLAERSRVTSTDVMMIASGLLKSANLAVFELGMWQSWTGR